MIWLIRRHVDLSRELGRGNTQLVQLILEDFAGMNGSHEHGLIPFPQ
jgi:hypothetical protein